MHCGDSVGTHQLYVVRAEPEAVGRDHTVAEQAQALAVFHRRAAPVLLGVLHFLLRLGKVDVDRQVILLGEHSCPAHIVCADCVRGVDCHFEHVERRERLRLLEGTHQRLPLLLGLDHVAVVEHAVGMHAADAHLVAGPCSDPYSPVHVVVAGGSRLDHLEAGQLVAPVEDLFVYLGFDLPYILEPRHQGHVFLGAAGHGHGSVGVHVDETGDGGHPAAVYDFGGGRLYFVSYLSDEIAADQDVAPLAAGIYVLEEYFVHKERNIIIILQLHSTLPHIFSIFLSGPSYRRVFRCRRKLPCGSSGE